MGCSDSMGNGCHSCMAAIFRSSDGQTTAGEEANGGEASLLGGETACNEACSRGGQGTWFVLLSLMAFIGPIVVTVVVVHLLEDRLGTLVAAIAGLAAAGLTVLISSAIVRRLDRSTVITGAGR